MSNKLKANNGSILPQNIGNMTLNELMNQEDVEIIKKGKSVKMKRALENKTISIEVRSYDDGQTISQSKFNKPESKKDLAETVRRMYYEDKMRQEDIAFTLDISQAYVSILLNKK